MNRRLVGMVAGGIGAALVLTACSNAVNTRQTISGPNGILLALPGVQGSAPQNSLFIQNVRTTADAWVLRAAEQAVVPAKAAQQAKAVEQTKAAYQEMTTHHCMGDMGD